MRQLAKHLKEHYYDKYAGVSVIPDVETILKALENHPEKILVDIEGSRIKGVAVFLMLEDATYDRLETINMTNQAVLTALLQQTGRNIHFILVTAESLRVLLGGRKQLKNLNPKTVSWWNPDMSKLHKYNFNREEILCHQ